MKFSIKVKTNSKKTKIEKIGKDSYIVFVKDAPIEGRANEAVVRILAKYFSVAKSQIEIISGFKSRQKIIEID